MVWTRKLAVYLVALSMLLWQSTAALAAPGSSKGQSGKASATTTTEAPAAADETTPQPECPVGDGTAETTEPCPAPEQPTEPTEPAEPTEPQPADPAHPATGKGKADVNLSGKGNAAAKNPNVGADGKLLPGTAAAKAAEAVEAAEKVAAVKAESRLQAKAERSKGEKGAYLVYVNGQRLNLTPLARSGRTLVPFRALAENLGASVEWVPSTQTVIMTKGDTTVEISIGGNTAKINGEVVELQTPPELVEGRTFVPLRFIAEALGADVDYDSETGAITVITLPGDGTTQPGDGTTQPGDGTTQPGDGTTQPGDGTTQPGDGTTQPGDGTTEPGDGTTQPGDGTTEPGDGTTQPGDGTTEPGDGTTQPGDGTNTGDAGNTSGGN